MLKNYLLNLLQACSEHTFGQDAIDWAIAAGLVQITGDLDADVRAIMLQYDDILVSYRQSQLPLAA